MPSAAHSALAPMTPRPAVASPDDDLLNFDHWLMPPVDPDARERLVSRISLLAGPVTLTAAVGVMIAAIL